MVNSSKAELLMGSEKNAAFPECLSESWGSKAMVLFTPKKANSDAICFSCDFFYGLYHGIHHQSFHHHLGEYVFYFFEAPQVNLIAKS